MRTDLGFWVERRASSGFFFVKEQTGMIEPSCFNQRSPISTITSQIYLTIFVRGKEKGKYNMFISPGCVNFQLSSAFSRSAAISTWPTIPHKPEPEPDRENGQAS